MISRFEVHLVRLDPTEGSEIRKTRPCVVVSPDEMNHRMATAIVAPMTTRTREYPSRIAVRFKGRLGEIALDQLRTVDQTRLIRRLGRVDERSGLRALEVLREMFSP